MSRNKTWTFAIVVLAALTIFGYQNCGKSGVNDLRNESSDSACRGASVVGTWASIDSPKPADTLMFYENCRGTSSYCASDFIYPVTESATVEFQVNRTNSNAGCPPTGKNTCTVGQFQPSPSVHQLQTTCGATTRRYQKQ